MPARAGSGEHRVLGGAVGVAGLREGGVPVTAAAMEAVAPATEDGEAAAMEAVLARIRSYGEPRAVVAFSGGVDSAVVVALAARALGREAVVAVTALSPSYPAGELEGAAAVCAGLGVEHRTIRTGEVERESYARNDALRCFHCKTELYGALWRVRSLGTGPGTVVLAGANADDPADFRPGILAAWRFGVRNPLLEAGVGKRAVRAVARALGLPVADKPAMACLSSRVAFGVRITPELLGRIDRAERAVRSLGFPVVRVRHLGHRAVIEVDPRDVARLRDHPGLPAVVRSLHALGWAEVEVDPRGYRAGSMNASLGGVPAATGGGRPAPAAESPGRG